MFWIAIIAITCAAVAFRITQLCLWQRTQIVERTATKITYIHDDGIYESHPSLFDPLRERDDNQYIIKTHPPELTGLARRWNGPSNTDLRGNAQLNAELASKLQNVTIHYADGSTADVSKINKNVG